MSNQHNAGKANVDRPAAAAKLSPQQRQIMVALLGYYRHYRASDLTGLFESWTSYAAFWLVDRS